MEWVKHDGYAIKSKDGRYSIASIGLNGGRCFEVWRTRLHEQGPKLVALNIADAKQARRIALEDANGEN